MQNEICEVIIEHWLLLKEYIPSKDRAAAAEHIISTAIDNGFTKHELIALADGDSDLSDAYELLNEEDELDSGDDDDNYNAGHEDYEND